MAKHLRYFGAYRQNPANHELGNEGLEEKLIAKQAIGERESTSGPNDRCKWQVIKWPTHK